MQQEETDRYYTVNSNLEAVTAKYEELLSTHTVLKMELAQQKKSYEKDLELLRSKLKAAKELSGEYKAQAAQKEAGGK